MWLKTLLQSQISFQNSWTRQTKTTTFKPVFQIVAIFLTCSIFVSSFLDEKIERKLIEKDLPTKIDLVIPLSLWKDVDRQEAIALL